MNPATHQAQRRSSTTPPSQCFDSGSSGRECGNGYSGVSPERYRSCSGSGAFCSNGLYTHNSEALVMNACAGIVIGSFLCRRPADEKLTEDLVLITEADDGCLSGGLYISTGSHAQGWTSTS